MMQRVALITGASDGIGMELARVMAADGWTLVLVARRGDRLERLAGELSAATDVHTIVADLSLDRAAERLAETVASLGLEVAALVNNAGFGDHSPFVESDPEKNRAMLRVNIEAVTELTREFVPAMVKRGNGYVVQLASVASFQPGPLMAVYYATKAYVLSFSQALAEELSGSGVSVTAVCPGPTQSGFQAVAQTERVAGLGGGHIPDSKTVARFSYRAMLKGRRVAIHGWSFRLLVFVQRALPRRLVTRLVGAFQAKRNP